MSFTYDQYLLELKNQQNLTAKTALRRLYELLKLEEPLMSKDDLYDRIMKDCLEIWQKRTIQNNMPDELKDPEFQEYGRRKKKVEIITGGSRRVSLVTQNGSVADDSSANSSNSYNSLPENKQIVDDLVGKALDQKPDDDKDLLIGKLQEDNDRLKQENKGLIESINTMHKKNPKILESPEYKSLEADFDLVKEELEELKQLERNRMKEHPEQTFQLAATIPKAEPTETTHPKGEFEIEFPARDLSTFWLDVKNCDKIMYFFVKGNQVVKWESDYARNKARIKAKQQS